MTCWHEHVGPQCHFWKKYSCSTSHSLPLHSLWCPSHPLELPSRLLYYLLWESRKPCCSSGTSLPLWHSPLFVSGYFLRSVEVPGDVKLTECPRPGCSSSCVGVWIQLLWRQFLMQGCLPQSWGSQIGLWDGAFDSSLCIYPGIRHVINFYDTNPHGCLWSYTVIQPLHVTWVKL